MEYEDEAEHIESTRYQGWEDNFNTLQMRLDPTPTLERIRNMLLSRRWDIKAEEWKTIPNLKPKMTEEGVDKLMLELYARMSVDKVLGNIKEKRINIFVRQIGEVILSFLWHCADQFELQENEFESVHYLVVHNIDMFLRRAEGALENKMLNKSMDYKEVINKRELGATSGGAGGFDNEPPSRPPRGFSFFGGGRR